MTQLDASPIPSDDLLLGYPVWFSLNGHHAAFAEAVGRACRYRQEVAPFAALPPDAEPCDWDDLARLVGPGGLVALSGGVLPPVGWQVIQSGAGVQLIDVGVEAERDKEAVPLGIRDVEQMLALVARTQPGPFAPRTVELGGYWGIRRAGVLVAMAGQRMHPPGWTEISAVCTDADHRGQGLATRLVKTVAAGIRARGERPLLHAAAGNVNAIRLYESMGFELRRRTEFALLKAPDAT